MQKIVVIGNGMVGYKFCEKLVAIAKTASLHITVFGEESRPAYDRVKHRRIAAQMRSQRRGGADNVHQQVN